MDDIVQDWRTVMAAYKSEFGHEVELRKQEEVDNAARDLRNLQHRPRAVSGLHLEPGRVSSGGVGGHADGSIISDDGGVRLDIDGDEEMADNGNPEDDSVNLGASVNSDTSDLKRPRPIAPSRSGRQKKLQKKAKPEAKVPLDFKRHIWLANPAYLARSGPGPSNEKRYLPIEEHLSGTQLANLRSWFEKCRLKADAVGFQNNGSETTRRCFGYTVISKSNGRCWDQDGTAFACNHCTISQQKGPQRACMRLVLDVDGQQEGIGDVDRVLEVLPLESRPLNQGAFGYWGKAN